MQLPQPGKYRLKELHQEIDLYDRKIAHCQAFEKFDTEGERSRAVERLAKKRKTLVRSAAEMASMGVEYDPNQLPRSLRNVEASAPGPATPAARIRAIHKVAAPAESKT